MRLGRMLSVGEVVEDTPIEEPLAQVAPAEAAPAELVEPSTPRAEEPVTADR